MITGVLLRHYKNYANMNFVPICDSECSYSVFVGNNGVGKSAILEALDVFFNNRVWNTTIGMKKSEALICPLFLIDKNKIDTNTKHLFDVVSDFYWNVSKDFNANTKKSTALTNFIQYRDLLKEKYINTHYLILIGISIESNKDAFCATFHSVLKDEIMKKLVKDEDGAQEVLNKILEKIYGLYNYLYIPVEESPSELLKLQNITMQKLLNKNVLYEIERILNRKLPNSNQSIVNQINENLDAFISEVNSIISNIDQKYSFSSEANGKKNLTAKDIREKVLEAYFPLRALKVNKRNVQQLSSGEQRKAIIDIAYSILVANGDKQTEKEIVLAIDEPETSMHVSNCFSQFVMLEELASKYEKQIIVTTHWYGFLPIAQKGNLHHINYSDEKINIKSFNMSNVLESRRKYPDVIELKSMYDLATSIITYMRVHKETNWIICEGSDDKIYLQYIMGERKDINILPVGGCGNVVKLYQLLYSPLTEKTEAGAVGGKALFLIDTDKLQKFVNKPMSFSNVDNNITLRRLQIDNGHIELYDPCVPNTYLQTEIEDCLDPKFYWEAITRCIKREKNIKLRNTIKKYSINDNATVSVLRGDESCIQATDSSVISKKKDIIEYVEKEENKLKIAEMYVKVCEESKEKVQHQLYERIVSIFDK